MLSTLIVKFTDRSKVFLSSDAKLNLCKQLGHTIVLSVEPVFPDADDEQLQSIFKVTVNGDPQRIISILKTVNEIEYVHEPAVRVALEC